MKTFVLTIMVLSLALAFSQTSAQAQAATESVLLNANSAAATAKAGSALGSALNHVNQQLGGQVQQVTHPTLGATSRRTLPTANANPVQGSAVRSATTPATGNLISSINGAEATNCVPTTTPSSTSDKTPVASAPADCKTSSSKPETQKYKSVVTVSFPQ